MPKIRTGQPLRSVERLLDVLASFTIEQSIRSNNEIAQDLELAPSTVRRLLATLEARGLVCMDRDTGRFRLAGQEDAQRIALAGELCVVAGPTLDELHDQTGESVALSVLDGAQGVHVDVRHGRRYLTAFTPVGHRVSVYSSGAIGKVLLAWLPSEQVMRLLPAPGDWEPRTPRSIASTPQFMRQLDKVRRDGYAINDGATTVDVWAVAAPVRDPQGRTVAALQTPVPRARLSTERKEALISAVVAAADRISEALVEESTRATGGAGPMEDGAAAEA